MMLSFRLALLTFLIVEPGLFVSGENEITCYENVQRLTCATGLIMVRSTIFGRTNSGTCSNARPASQVANTNCILRTPSIAKRCNGLRQCEVKTDLLGDIDPCFGTYKYYNTTYDCISGNEVEICEQGYEDLDCGDLAIQVINANYGRANSVTCVNGLPSNQIQNTNCYAPGTYSNVASRCNGLSKCTVEASNSIYQDPCFGTSKYLTVSYLCHPIIKESVTCEGPLAATLTCGARSIRLISANYGRTDSTTCAVGRPASEVSNTNCYDPNSFNKVSASCEGRNSCQVPATNSFFSDPCYGTYKYLRIVYSCL